MKNNPTTFTFGYHKWIWYVLAWICLPTAFITALVLAIPMAILRSIWEGVLAAWRMQVQND